MKNSLGGSVGTLKRENSYSTLNTTLNDSILERSNSTLNITQTDSDLEKSCSAVTPSSSNASLFKSNKIAALLEYNEIDLNPSNSILENLKFEEIYTELQSPDYSIWESLFTDQVDLSPDLMMYSPKVTPDVKISSPMKMTTGTQTLGNNQNYSHLQGPNQLGSSPSHILNKGKAQSPLHKIFNSPKNRFMQPESFVLPGMEGLVDEYRKDGLGAYNSTKKTSGFGSSPENFELTLLEMLDLPTPNSLKFGDEIYDPLASEQDSGLQLVHLLLACAEAVAKEEYMSARRFLHNLNRIVTPLGDSMQRVASCFTDALGARLATALTTNSNSSTPKSFAPFVPNSLDTLKIYQIVYQACPYIKFAHFTANQTIFEAFESEERVHVIDLDILQGYQWPAFMQALAARRGGPPFLRITGVGSPQESVRETGRGLTELAHSLHIPFAFHPVGERLEDIKPHMFQRRIGEALAVNSVNCLHRVPGGSLGNLLGMIRDQAPNVVTLVEQESSHNGPYFLGRFLEALHYYSAIFDSLDATFPIDSPERAKVEQYIFAPEIKNIVACEGSERVERHERLEKWRKMMEGKGFKGVALSGHAVTQSKMLLGLYPCAGYRLREDRGCLLLGWQDRAILAASAWRC
ncbi:hypothetical protein IFM89_031153 [Coptis chinensis]|uniref:Uncharacterized protein n=1 Tax=Coptis chinensis TaxID=261450 RepID=A0A835IR49_9MAGN|nr:hypothetical protein IFM89_031153 [Coptis chinensis]